LVRRIPNQRRRDFIKRDAIGLVVRLVVLMVWIVARVRFVRRVNVAGVLMGGPGFVVRVAAPMFVRIGQVDVAGAVRFGVSRRTRLRRWGIAAVLRM